jgi:hypothetical protein
MLDGHGRIRITDSGLATAAEDETQAAETIAALLPDLRVRELVRVLNAENEPAIAQRLGFYTGCQRREQVG